MGETSVKFLGGILWRISESILGITLKEILQGIPEEYFEEIVYDYL